jgi:hypothetical protein
MVGATMTKAQQPSLTASSNRTSICYRANSPTAAVMISKTWMAHIDAAARM